MRPLVPAPLLMILPALSPASGQSLVVEKPEVRQLVPETPANLCFGGKNRDELFITARTSPYHIKLTTTAAGKPGRDAR